MALQVGKSNSFTTLLKEGYKHVEDAILRNISACLDLCKITRSSFGPYGMNKLIVNQLDKLFVTNDANTIIRELDVVHPAAKLLVMASQQQEQESGDQTNFVIVFAGELLKKAEEMMTIGIHPSDIIDGYERAFELASVQLKELVVQTISNFKNEKELIFAIRSAISSKQVGLAICSTQYGYEDFLSRLVAEACVAVMPENNPKNFNVDCVRVVKIMGRSIMESTVFSGMVFNREPESRLQNATSAKIAIFSCPLDIGRTETKGTVLLHNADELLSFSSGEEKLIEEQVKEIAETGVKVVVTGGTIGEIMLHYINQYELVAVRIPSKFDLMRLCKATGATALARLGAPMAEEMGFCDSVEVTLIGADRCTIFRRETSKIASIILRGSTLNFLDDVERAIDDGVSVVKSLTKDGRILPGAGATEMALAAHLQQVSSKTPGLMQYGIKKFGEALESIPKILCDNSGIDYHQVISQLSAAHDAGSISMGVDVESSSQLIDTIEAKIMDIYSIKASALHLAVDATLSVLRIDSIVMSKPAGGIKPRKLGSTDSIDD